MELKQLNNLMKRLRPKRRSVMPPTIQPESTFDAVLEMRLSELQQQIAEVKGRVNSLFFFALGAVLLQVALRIIPELSL